MSLAVSHIMTIVTGTSLMSLDVSGQPDVDNACREITGRIVSYPSLSRRHRHSDTALPLHSLRSGAAFRLDFA